MISTLAHQIVAVYEAALADHPNVAWALIDHISSPTATLMPVEALVATCRARGVLVMVDGAHAPGQLPLALSGKILILRFCCCCVYL